MPAESIKTGYPDWVRTVLREAPVRRALILYGNTRDEFYDPHQRQYVTLPEYLIRLLQRDKGLGFTIAGTWDHVDGLRFSDSRMISRFQNAIRGHGNQPAMSDQAYDVGDAEAAPPPADGETGLYADPSEFMPALRSLLRHGTERPLIVLDWHQLVYGQAAHLDLDERRLALQVGKVLVGPPVVTMNSDQLRRGRSLLIVLANNLGAIPTTIYQGEPRVRLIAVPLPGRPERNSYFGRHMDDLNCERPKPAGGEAGTVSAPPAQGELADTLADLTDRLSLVDLRQILSLSLRTESALMPDHLLNLYRLGEQRSPWEDLSEEKLQSVENTLKRRVVGQDKAVRRVATMVIRAYMGLAGLEHSGRRSSPKGKLFFVGPTGVGKTELAKALAEFLFGDESAFIRFDMSEYNHEHSDQRLVGAPPGYVGFEEGGQLTNAIRERPFSVLLFDEIEKGHPRILDKFLQILEDGRLTDGRGETAYFSECVIIFTSNIGASNMPTNADAETLRMHFRQSVEKHFVHKLGRPELLNRLGDNVVVFDPINDASFQQGILARKIQPLAGSLLDRFGVQLRLSDELRDRLLQTARSEQGGRGVVNAVEGELINPLAWFLFQHKHQLRRGRVLQAGLEAGRIGFELGEG